MVISATDIVIVHILSKNANAESTSRQPSIIQSNFLSK
jgi:hypothetical protein